MNEAFAINTFAALLLGVLVGIERQFRHHVAGLKTNALVSVGAAVYVGLSLLMEHESSPNRIAAQVVSGLGFLGGGVILREGFNVRGLNTAATIWCSGAIGSLCGAGFLSEATVGTAAILTANIVLLPLTRWIDSLQAAPAAGAAYYRVRTECESADDQSVREVLLENIAHDPRRALMGLQVEGLAPHRTIVEARVMASEPNDEACEQLVARMGLHPKVKSASWQRTES